MIETLVVISPSPPENRSLLDTVLDEIEKKGLRVVKLSFLDEFGNINFYDLKQKLHSMELDVTHLLVLDFGRLPSRKLRAVFPDVKLVLFAADTPQTYYGSSLIRLLASRIKHKIKGKKVSPYGENYGVIRCAKHYDLTLCSDLQTVSKLKEFGYQSEWFPYWFDSLSSGNNFQNIPKFDLVSVMTERNERLELLRYLKTSSEFRFRNFSGITGQEVFEKYSTGSLVLNQSQYGEVTIRIFEALGTGRLVVTSPISIASGINSLFVEGEDYFVWNDEEEVASLIHYILKDKTKLSRLSASARAKVLRSHTAGHRAKQLLELLGKL